MPIRKFDFALWVFGAACGYASGGTLQSLATGLAWAAGIGLGMDLLIVLKAMLD